MKILLLMPIVIILVYYLYIIAKVIKTDARKINKNLKMDFIISVSILVIMFFIILIRKELFIKFYFQGYIALVFSYSINIRLLINIINTRRREMNLNIKIAFLIIFVIIINLSMGAYLCKFQDAIAYNKSPTFFEMIYYTVVTFVTIGFGDIIPISNLAKFISIVIALTSILCLIIFINCILKDN